MMYLRMAKFNVDWHAPEKHCASSTFSPAPSPIRSRPQCYPEWTWAMKIDEMIYIYIDIDIYGTVDNWWIFLDNRYLHSLYWNRWTILEPGKLDWKERATSLNMLNMPPKISRSQTATAQKRNTYQLICEKPGSQNISKVREHEAKAFGNMASSENVCVPDTVPTWQNFW